VIPYIGKADGSPCPTVVLDRRTVPEDRGGLATSLARLRRLFGRGAVGWASVAGRTVRFDEAGALPAPTMGVR